GGADRRAPARAPPARRPPCLGCRGSASQSRSGHGSAMSEPTGRGGAWTEERGTSDKGRDRLKAPRRASGQHSIQFALLAGPLLAMLDSSIVNVAVAPI